MHFVLSPFGSSGDVFPMLGLAVELKRRGFPVTVATNPHFRARVLENELAFVPIGEAEDYHRIASHPDIWHPRRSFGHLFRSLNPFLQPQYESIQRLASEGPVTAIVNCFGFGALAAQEKFGTPVYTLHLQPAVLWSNIAPPKMPNLFGPSWMKRLLFAVGEKWVVNPTACPIVNDWRKSIGLPPVQRIMDHWNSPKGILCLFPEWYAPAQSDWPQPCIQTDFPLWNLASELSVDSEIECFLEQADAPIVFTPGSANMHGGPFFQAAVESCRRLGKRGLLLTEYAEQIPANLPESVRWFRYAPLDRLLPRAAAFVHHGGIGSASQALLAGIPQLIMPLAHDQFDNADRLANLGVARELRPKHFTSDRLTGELKGMLSSRGMLDRCRQIASRMDKSRGISQLADYLATNRG